MAPHGRLSLRLSPCSASFRGPTVHQTPPSCTHLAANSTCGGLGWKLVDTRDYYNLNIFPRTQGHAQVLRYDVAEVRPVSLRDIRLAERERDRDARQLQQQVLAAATLLQNPNSSPALSPV